MVEEAGKEEILMKKQEKEEEEVEELARGGEGGGSGHARFLRVVYRVKSLDQSVQFYIECFGMKLLSKYVHALENYESALVGYGPQTTHFIVELRSYFKVYDFQVGTGFGHIGINVEDVCRSLELIKAKGGKVIRDALKVKGASTICAFVQDPNGYEIELLQRCFTGDPLCQVMLRVIDLNRAINFYTKAFRMQLLRTFQLEVSGTKFRLAFLGFGPEDITTVLELNSILGVAEYDKGNTFLEIVIGFDDIHKTYQCIQEAGGEVTKSVEEGDTRSITVFDLDGWKMVLVKNNVIEE